MPRKGGAQKREKAVLPKLDNYVVDALKDYMMTHYDMNRPPEVAAAVLALVCELHRTGAPFPNRHDVAEHLNCSVFGLDAALSTALSRHEITLTMNVSPGNIAGRESVVKHRVFHPSEEILSVVRRAKRRAA